MKLILALLLWIAVGIFNAAISVVFNIPMDSICKIEVAIGLIVMALYLHLEMSNIIKEVKREKGSKFASNILAILFKWLGPICMVWIGICILSNW